MKQLEAELIPVHEIYFLLAVRLGIARQMERCSSDILWREADHLLNMADKEKACCSNGLQHYKVHLHTLQQIISITNVKFLH